MSKVLAYDHWSPVENIVVAPLHVLILMHGRGANRQDLSALQPRLPRSWHVIVPDAPHAGAPWGYGPGLAWYRFMGDDRPDSDSIGESLSSLDALISALPDIMGGVPAQLVMGGFSQGGTMGNAYAMTRSQRAHRLQGVLNFSGFVPSTIPLAGDAIEGTRFFWGHGMDDDSIPFALAEKGRTALRAVGADVESHDYNIGHWIDPTELRDASAWMNTL